MKLQGNSTGPKYLSKKIEKWRRRRLEEYDMVRRMDRQEKS